MSTGQRVTYHHIVSNETAERKGIREDRFRTSTRAIVATVLPVLGNCQCSTPSALKLWPNSLDCQNSDQYSSVGKLLIL